MKVDLEWSEAAMLIALIEMYGLQGLRELKTEIVYAMRDYEGDPPDGNEKIEQSETVQRTVSQCKQRLLTWNAKKAEKRMKTKTAKAR